jgi:hypothetical protein
MTLQEVLREESARLGVPEGWIELAMRFSETLVTPGACAKERLFLRDLGEKEEEWVRLEFRKGREERHGRVGGEHTERIMGLN